MDRIRARTLANLESTRYDAKMAAWNAIDAHWPSEDFDAQWARYKAAGRLHEAARLRLRRAIARHPHRFAPFAAAIPPDLFNRHYVYGGRDIPCHAANSASGDSSS